MRPAFTAMIACLALAACVNVNDTPVSTRPAQITTQERGLIQSTIIDGMKDPASAQLRNLVAYDLSDGQGRAICGEVNGKNAFGGYVGFQPFFMRVKDGRLVSSYYGTGDPNDLDHFMARKGCGEAATGMMKISSTK
ncbi:hypothetical protein FQV27_08715 [Paracoccus aurantiacus]|uniref:Uncharacterized protein n=1 Tax=Paracoccus aurantiacus TaxID=2599412 RepID=A0A5C6S350_9RHOB|nr:hypothetical protein [Paracoccus aurantiacus]TXB69050.1 hypothetical protein FQV27_08715 [Paracoccus aurantiacus]